jgi:hypothetical protein
VALPFPRSVIGASVPARAAALAAGLLLATLSSAFLLWALLTRSAAQFAWLTSMSNIIAAFLTGTAAAVSLVAWSTRSAGKRAPDFSRPRLVSLAEADPFALEVKRPLEAVAARPQMPALTSYVRRDHDTKLVELAKAATRGESQIAVVYGESSTGKTRACWEMLAPLRAASPAWRLWHPIDPAPSIALLAGLPLIGPRTVIWLNEARAYLNTPDEAGEKAAAALRELIRDPSRGPILVIATLWPGDWRALTEQPRQPDDVDRHSNARELLAGRGHRVPSEFTPTDPDELKRQSADDPRLAEAVSRAPGRRIIQYLAGVPLLMDRYDSASTPTRALIHAAMDARRMGHGKALPLELLANAAPGYMSGDDPDLYGGSDWLAAALADASRPLASGIEGPLTRVRAKSRHRRGQKPDQGKAPEPGDCYHLAEYLDQHGRRERHDIVPPPAFWDAALGTTAGDLVALAYSARRRGLLRTAALPSKQAALQSAWAAVELVEVMNHVCPGDQRAAQWSAVHAPVSQTDGVANLINAVKELAGVRFLAPLLAREPAAWASLDDPHAIADLIYALEQAGAPEQAEILAARAARDAALSRPYAVADLLGHLHEQGNALRAGAVNADVLAERAARDAALDDPRAVAAVLDALVDMKAAELTAILLSRGPARYAALRPPESVAVLLGALRRAGASEQAAALAARVARGSPLTQPATTAGLLGVLLESGDQRQARALLSRDPASQTDVKDPRSVAGLLRVMQKAGADGQADILARRALHEAALDDPGGTAVLLVTLHRAGAREHASAVAGRASREASLSEPQGIIALLDAVREAGASDDGTLLLRRAVENCPRLPSSVPWLVNWLWDNGSPEKALRLASSGSADIPAEDLLTVLSMLAVLRRIQAREQAAALLARDPASHVVLDTAHQADANYLLSELRKAGAAEQASILTGRLPTGGLIDLFLSQDQNRGQYPFGREQDGSPASPWGWDSLCQ